jgi:iron-sulfur cluster repair protein YtfE (RIC family)
MDDTPQLIDQLIAEHSVIGEKALSLEKAANDAGLLSGLKRAGETFVRGDVSGRDDLKKLEVMVNEITDRLDKHFTREEKVLRPAVKSYGDEKLVLSLDSLLFEHTDLRDRLLHSRKRVDELLGAGLEGSRRDAALRDFRIHLNHSRKLLETHAARENHFLAEFRRHLKKAVRKEKP